MAARLRKLRDDRLILAGVLVAVAGLTVALRLPGAIALPLWQDEVASAWVIVQPTLGEVVDQVRKTESTPPLWYMAAWVGHEAGVSLDGLRMLSVVFAVALSALVVVYARRLMPLWAAALAGLLAGAAWQLVAHGRELRAYALYALVSLLFAVALAAAARRPTRLRLVGLASCAAVGLLTHYFFALTLLGGLLWLWTGQATKEARLRITVAACAGAAPLLAFAPILVDQYSAQRFSWISDFDPLKVAYLYGTIFDWGGSLYGPEGAPFGPRQLLWLFALGVVAAGAIVLWRRSDEGRLCALLAVAPFVGASAVWLAGPDIFTTRNLLCIVPFALVAVAAALSALPRQAAVAASVAIVGLAAAGTASGPPLGPPADRVARELLAQGWETDDRIVLFGDLSSFRSPVGWYLPGRPLLRVTSTSDNGEGLFVIAHGLGTWQALRDFYALEPLRLSRVENVFVARLPADQPLAEELASIGGYVLAAPGRVIGPGVRVG